MLEQIITGVPKKTVQDKLTRFAKKFPSLALLVLASVDGFALLSSGKKANDAELTERLSAMVSSMAALADAAGREFQSPDFEVALLHFHKMYLAFRVVKAPEASFVIAAIIENPENLGAFSKALRDCAVSLETTLKNSQTSTKETS